MSDDWIKFRGSEVPDWVPRDLWPKELQFHGYNASHWRQSTHSGKTTAQSLDSTCIYRLPASLKPAEEKTPQPGEWWEDEDGNLIKCIAIDTDGNLWWQDRNDGSNDVAFSGAYAPIRHLPDCTDFSYEIPEEPEPDNEWSEPFTGADVPDWVPGELKAGDWQVVYSQPPHDWVNGDCGRVHMSEWPDSVFRIRKSAMEHKTRTMQAWVCGEPGNWFVEMLLYPVGQQPPNAVCPFGEPVEVPVSVPDAAR